MACSSCNGQGDYSVQTVCACCKIVDGDDSIKFTQWCQLCGVHLCKKCWTNIPRRIKAFGKQFFGIE